MLKHAAFMYEIMSFNSLKDIYFFSLQHSHVILLRIQWCDRITDLIGSL